MIQNNYKEFEICGIFNFWNKGYKGKGIKIAELESAFSSLSIFDGKLYDPFNQGTKNDINEHGQYVLEVMHEVAPDANLYTLPNGFYIENGVAKGSFIEKTLPFVEQEKIDIVGASLGGINNDLLNTAVKKSIEKGCIFVCSAGNNGINGLNGYSLSNTRISIGAVLYNDKYDSINIADYSSRGKDLDFVMFSGLSVLNAKYPNQTFDNLQGTSFSSPMFCGMIALAQQFFYEKTGKKLNQEQMYKFVQDHVKDLGELGFDEVYGYGLFVLPDPDTIDVKKYTEGDDYMFKDIDSVSSWAKESVIKMEELGLMSGDNNGNFNPKNNLTREEFAVVLNRLYKLLKQ